MKHFSGSGVSHIRIRSNSQDFLAFSPLMFPQYDIAFFEVNPEPQFYFELNPHYKPVEGADIYFGGFPLTQPVPTFHKGNISSIFTQDGREFLTVDASTLPGYSGSPILTLEEGQLIPIGILNITVADAAQEFKLLKQKLGTMRDTGLSLIHGETVLNPINAMADIMDFMQRNLSTGIGKGLTFSQLFNLPHPETAFDFDSELEIAKTKKASEPPSSRLPSENGFQKANKDIQKQCINDYIPHKIKKMLGGKVTDSTQVTVPEKHSKIEGDILKTDPHLRLDLQYPHQFGFKAELNIHEAEKVYASWQFQFGVGNSSSKGGAYGGVLMLTGRPFTVGDMKSAFLKSFETQRYAILTFDKGGLKKMLYKDTQRRSWESEAL